MLLTVQFMHLCICINAMINYRKYVLVTVENSISVLACCVDSNQIRILAMFRNVENMLVHEQLRCNNCKTDLRYIRIRIINFQLAKKRGKC